MNMNKYERFLKKRAELEGICVDAIDTKLSTSLDGTGISVTLSLRQSTLNANSRAAAEFLLDYIKAEQHTLIAAMQQYRKRIISEHAQFAAQEARAVLACCTSAAEQQTNAEI